MKVSLIQSNPGSDKAANLAEAKALMERAIALDSPDFVMLPEVFDWMGSPGPDKTQAAEAERDGPSYRMCQSIAREHKVWVHAGSFRTTIAGEDRCHNTTVVFNRDGREVARYHKIHLFDITSPDGASYRESATFKPGDNIVTYECEGITVGCAICYDVRFPELFQALVKRGAQIITLPAAFTLQTGMDHWEVLCRARAIETETYFLACGMTGTFQHGAERRATYGNSLVVDPWGHVIAKASNGVGHVSARLDPARIARVRAQIPVSEHKAVGVRIPG